MLDNYKMSMWLIVGHFVGWEEYVNRAVSAVGVQPEDETYLAKMVETYRIPIRLGWFC